MTEIADDPQAPKKISKFKDPDYYARLFIPSSVWYFRGENKKLSISSKLKSQGRLNEEMEILIGLLTLEELISIKLEYSVKNTFSGKGRFYGMSLLKALPIMVQAVVLRFALISFPTSAEARGFLDLSKKNFLNNIHVFGFNIDKLKWTKDGGPKYNPLRHRPNHTKI